MIRKFLSMLLLLVMALVVFVPAYAGGPEVPAQTPHWRFFMNVGSGYSWSRDAGVRSNPIFWDPAIEGYDSDLSGTEFYGAGIGFLWDDYLSLGVNVVRRPDYQYRKTQMTASEGEQPSNFIGDRIRFFDLANTSIMLDTMIYLGHWNNNLLWQLSDHSTMQLLVGGGVGVAYNTLSNFHSVATKKTSGPFPLVTNIGNETTETHFAWEVVAGLHFEFGDRVAFDLGYRYFDAGDFVGPDYVYEVFESAGLRVPHWTGELKAHEVFVNLIYKFGSRFS